jgi:hypothetical protein
MSKDVESLVEQINSADQERQIESQRFVEEQNIKKALGPDEWKRLKRNLMDHCEQMQKSTPVRLQIREEGPYLLILTNLSDGRKARLAYNADVPCVQYETPADSGYFPFRVSRDGTMVQFMARGVPTFHDEISVIIIQHTSAGF